MPSASLAARPESSSGAGLEWVGIASRGDVQSYLMPHKLSIVVPVYNEAQTVDAGPRPGRRIRSPTSKKKSSSSTTDRPTGARDYRRAPAAGGTGRIAHLSIINLEGRRDSLRFQTRDRRHRDDSGRRSRARPCGFPARRAHPRGPGGGRLRLAVSCRPRLALPEDARQPRPDGSTNVLFGSRITDMETATRSCAPTSRDR